MKMTKRTPSTVCIITVSICLAISFIIFAVYAVVAIDSMVNQNELIFSSEYATYVADDDIITKKYDLEPCDTLRFFDDNERKHAVFSNAKPELKIVDDSEYFVEITANGKLHDVIDIRVKDGTAIIECKDEKYNKVSKHGISDVDFLGLNVGCTNFDLTVHAPIAYLYSYTNLELDFQPAKGDTVYVDLSYGNTNGVVSGIEAEIFKLSCSGTTKLTVEGSVSDTADIRLWHNSKINAENLSAKNWNTDVSRGIGGFSYIVKDKWYQFEMDFIGGPTNILEFFVVAPLIIWICLEIKLIKDRNKTELTKAQKDQESEGTPHEII